MKKPLLIVLILLFTIVAKAQLPSKDSVFVAVEVMPHFKNGDFLTYIAQNVRYPANSYLNHIQGKVFVQFIIEHDGSLTNAKIIRPVSPDIDAEALRVINSSPKWLPGIQNGRTVRVIFTVPITFRIQPQKTDSIAKQNAAPDSDILNATVESVEPPKAGIGIIFAAVEYEPGFPGGMDKFNEFIKNFEKEHFPDIKIQGRTIVTFVVEPDGTLSSPQVLRSTDPALVDATLTMIKNCPKWVPGIQNRKHVRVQYTVKVDFNNG